MIKQLTLSRLTLVPNQGKATNMGGISYDPSTKQLYAIKTSQANDESALFRFSTKTWAYKTVTFSGGVMNHGNGIAYDRKDKHVAVAPGGEYIQDVTLGAGLKWKNKKMVSEAYAGAIAYMYEDRYLIRTGKYAFAVMQKKDGVFRLVLKFKIQNPWDEKGFTIPQDIEYHNSSGYAVYSREDKKRNLILRWKITTETLKKGATLTPQDIYLSKESSALYEWESVTFMNKYLLISANTKAGDYIYKAEV